MAKIKIAMEIETEEPMFSPDEEEFGDLDISKACIAGNILSTMRNQLVTENLVKIAEVHSGRSTVIGEAQKEATINFYRHQITFWEKALASIKIDFEE